MINIAFIGGSALSKKFVDSVGHVLSSGIGVVSDCRNFEIEVDCGMTETEMRSLNKKIFGKFEPTDVISLVYPGLDVGRAEAIDGFVFVSVGTLRSFYNVSEADLSFELARSVVHGVLHVVGFDHVLHFGDPGWEQEEMLVLQEKILQEIQSY